MGSHSAPKGLGQLGVEASSFFSSALAVKASWRLISSTSLWLMVSKTYLRSPNKETHNCPIIWKAISPTFPIIKNGLAWKIGNGQNFDLILICGSIVMIFTDYPRTLHNIYRKGAYTSWHRLLDRKVIFWIHKCGSPPIILIFHMFLKSHCLITPGQWQRAISL